MCITAVKAAVSYPVLFVGGFSMQKQWVHDKYAVGRRRVFVLDPALELRLGLPRKHTSAKGLDITTIIICAAVITLLSTMPLVIVKSRSNPLPMIVASELPKLNTHLLEPRAKDFFYSRLSLKQKKQFSSLVHYVSDIIRTTRNASLKPRELAYTIVSESLAANYDPLFVASLILAESSFRKHVRSSRGAIGLMQIQPTTGRYVSEIYGVKWHGSERLEDPQYNIQLGIAYLKYLEKLFDGNLTHALVAYNWGPSNVRKVLKGDKSRMPKSSLIYSREVQSKHKHWTKDLIAKNLRYESMSMDLSRG